MAKQERRFKIIEIKEIGVQRSKREALVQKENAGVTFLSVNRSTVSLDMWGWLLATALVAGSHWSNHPRSHWVFGVYR